MWLFSWSGWSDSSPLPEGQHWPHPQPTLQIQTPPAPPNLSPYPRAMSRTWSDAGFGRLQRAFSARPFGLLSPGGALGLLCAVCSSPRGLYIVLFLPPLSPTVFPFPSLAFANRPCFSPCILSFLPFPPFPLSPLPSVTHNREAFVPPAAVHYSPTFPLDPTL